MHLVEGENHQRKKKSLNYTILYKKFSKMEPKYYSTPYSRTVAPPAAPALPLDAGAAGLGVA